MIGSAIQPEIHELIENRDFRTLKSVVSSMEVHDLAELLGEIEGEDLAVAFRLLPRDCAAEVFGMLDVEQQEHLLGTLSSARMADILHDMAPDDRTDLLEELPGELAQKLLNELRGEEAKVARRLLAYPEDSIAREMTPEYVAVRPDWTVGRVFEHIRKVAPTRETLNVIYVTDDRWRLLDELPLELLVLVDPELKVVDLMDYSFVALRAQDDREDAIDVFKKYDVVALPVINSQGVLVGIVTIDDVMDVVEEEDTEDFHKIAGLEPLEYSYFQTSFLGMVRKRLPWLIMLLGAQTLTTLALTQFNALELFAALVVFMPLINSPAGNTGSQISSLVIRGLALQEFAAGDWKRVLARELPRGLVMGVLLGGLGFVTAVLFGRLLPDRPPQLSSVGLAVALAILLVVTFANLVGAMLPFFFKRFGIDPAATSGPFIASVMDVSGIVIYFTIAMTIVSLVA